MKSRSIAAPIQPATSTQSYTLTEEDFREVASSSPKSIQQPDDKREREPNGPFNPPLEQIQVTRGKRGGYAFIVNGKRIERRLEE